MAPVPRRKRGFTLIELMITIAVALLLALLALPSFISFRQRTALRSETEQVLSFWNQARFESAKRNQLVKVGVKTSGANFCMGAATTTDPADATPCDCFTANACDVAGYPAPPATLFNTQSEWQGVSFVTVSGTTPNLGGTDKSVAVLEPKRGGLTDGAQAGSLTFADPAGSKDYKLNLRIDPFGRALLCESTLAADHMPEYNNRRCSP